MAKYTKFNLKARAKKAGYTLTRLAYAIGVAPGTVSHWVRWGVPDKRQEAIKNVLTGNIPKPVEPLTCGPSPIPPDVNYACANPYTEIDHLRDRISKLEYQVRQNQEIVIRIQVGS
jgi:hypothetical protein